MYKEKNNNLNELQDYKIVNTRQETVPQTVHQTIHESTVVVIPPEGAVFFFRIF